MRAIPCRVHKGKKCRLGGIILRVPRKPNLSRRELMAERFERGECQVRIAQDLRLSPASVRYYLRLAGVPGAV